MVIFSSAGFANENLFAFCKENILQNYSIINSSIITTAAVPEKDKNKWAVFTKEYLYNKNIKNITLFDFEKDKIETLYRYNLIIILGGNPFNLLYYIRKTMTDKILLEIADSDKIIIGISAGGMIFGTGIYYVEEWNKIMGFDTSKDNMIGLSDYSGLKYKEITIFPHYDIFLQMNTNLEKELKRIEERDSISIYRLKNDRSIYFKDEKIIEIK
jgi:dipeptidase E